MAKVQQQGLLVAVLALLGFMVLCCGAPMALLGTRPAAEIEQAVQERQSRTADAGVSVENEPIASASWVEPLSDATPVDPFDSVAEKPAPELASPINTVAPKLQSSEKSATSREWKSHDGKFSVTAKFAGWTEGKVSLQRQDGKSVAVSILLLSLEDRDYVGEMLRVDPDSKIAIGVVSEVLGSDALAFTDLSDQKYTVHLAAIAGPTQVQPYGSEAFSLLIHKTYRQVMWLEWRREDESQHLLGTLFVDGRNINLEMVAEGAAWHHDDGNSTPRYANAQFVAKNSRLGLWALENPQPPWKFR